MGLRRTRELKSVGLGLTIYEQRKRENPKWYWRSEPGEAGEGRCYLWMSGHLAERWGDAPGWVRHHGKHPPSFSRMSLISSFWVHFNICTYLPFTSTCDTDSAVLSKSHFFPTLWIHKKTSFQLCWGHVTRFRSMRCGQQYLHVQGWPQTPVEVSTVCLFSCNNLSIHVSKMVASQDGRSWNPQTTALRIYMSPSKYHVTHTDREIEEDAKEQVT